MSRTSPRSTSGWMSTASEARARGGFFPLRAAAAFALVSADLQAGLESFWAELQRHVAGHLHDDVALLLIERSR